jgi:hypothetical protein
MSSLQSYYKNINNLVINEDGEKLTKLLRLPIKTNGTIIQSSSMNSLAILLQESKGKYKYDLF